MTYGSLDEVFAANEDVRRKLYAQVEALGEARHGARGAAGGWSVAEIVEHLSITERRVSQALDGMLPQVEVAAGGDDAGAKQSFVPFSLDAFVEQARDQKFEAPEMIRPRGVALPDALAHLKESRAALEAMRPRFERADYAVKFPHPAFGPLNVGQWLAFVGIHEERHLRQIGRVIETMT